MDPRLHGMHVHLQGPLAMRYSYITPRVAPVVCESVIKAREEVGRAMREGSAPKIETAYTHLEQADRIARMRRSTARAMRAVGVDPTWERMCAMVEAWRK